MTDRNATEQNKKRKVYLQPRLGLSGIADVDMLILCLLPDALAPLLRTVCSSWASSIPRHGLSPDRDDYDYIPEDLPLYLAEQGLFSSLKWLSRCAAPFGDTIPFLSKLVMHGKPKYLEWALDASGRFHRITEEDAISVCNLMARWGKLDLLDWALSRDDFGKCAMVGISEFGHATSIVWALIHGVPCSWRAYTTAAEYDDIDLLYLLSAYAIPLSPPDGVTINDRERPEYAAAKSGSIAVLEWLRSLPCYFIRPHPPTIAAAAAGHMEVLRWLAKNKLLHTRDPLPCILAARYDNREILRWMHFDKGCPWHEAIASEAARSGHSSLFFWLYSQGCPYKLQDVMSCATNSAHTDIIEWCVSKGARWDPLSLNRAAESGHLETLRWCRARGALWDENICKSAVCGNQIAVLRWLVSEEGGARNLLDPGCVASASRRGQIKVVKILVRAGCPMNSEAIQVASQNGDLNIVRLLSEEGCPMPRFGISLVPILIGTAKTFMILDWLYSHGCDWTPRAYDDLLECTNPDVSTWARRKGHPAVHSSLGPAEGHLTSLTL